MVPAGLEAAEQDARSSFLVLCCAIFIYPGWPSFPCKGEIIVRYIVGESLFSMCVRGSLCYANALTAGKHFFLSRRLYLVFGSMSLPIAF
jgi:hypothetical protein